MQTLVDPLLGTDDPDEHFTPKATVSAMLWVERKLAAVLERCGVIPAGSAASIARCCEVEHFDLAALAREGAQAGNVAIPLVKALTEQVRRRDPAAARFVHWGATSQDILDTALILQLQLYLRYLDEGVDDQLDEIERLLARHAWRWRDQPMAGRTWMQQALPVTFGLKAAGWLDAIGRHRQRLAELTPRLLTLQFGGAAGTLAALGDKGPAVAAALAEELGLALPALPWHGLRDRIGEFGCWLGLLVGTLGKIARDLSLMGQTEVGEVLEGRQDSRGGSSTMPHKRNPVGAAVVLAAAQRAPGLVATLLSAQVQEHERGLGGWQAEWAVLPELCRVTEGALYAADDLLRHLELRPERMAENLARSQGLILSEAVALALGRTLGKRQAHELVERAARQAVTEQRSLAEVLSALPEVTAQLSSAEIERLLRPEEYLGSAGVFVDRALADYEQRRGYADYRS